MDRLELFEKRIAKVEENQADIYVQLIKINDRLDRTQFQDLKEKTLNEVEYQLEIQSRRKIFDEIDGKIKTLQSVDQNVVEIMHKLQVVTDDEISELKKEVDVLKNDGAEKQMESHSNLLFLQKQIDDLKKEVDVLKSDGAEKQMESYSDLIIMQKQIDECCQQIFEMKKKETEARECNEKELSYTDLKYEPSEFFQVYPNILQRKDLNKNPSLVWKIPGITRKLLQLSIQNKSKAFAITGYPFLAQVLVRTDRLNISFFICFINPDASKNETLQLTVAPRVHFLLQCHSRSEEPQDLVRSGSLKFGTSLRFDTYYNFRRFNLSKTLLVKPSYVAVDAVTMEFHVEPPDVANRVHSRDGTLSWTIFNYRECLELERKGLMLYQQSPYFYTAPRGYRVQAVFFLNGDEANQGQGLSVGILFLTGEFDRELCPSFLQSTTLTMLNPNNPERQLTKTISHEMREENTSYLFHLWDHHVIKRYLVNDSLAIKVLIKAQ